MSRAYIDLRNKKQLYANKAEKLKYGVCGEILPLSIIKSKRMQKGVYHTEGYRKLSSFGEMTAAEALSVVEGVLVMIEKLKDNLFFPEEYILSPDTVYADEKKQKYMITYIPAGTKQKAKTAVSCFIGEMKRYTTPDGKMYLEALKNITEGGDLKTGRMIGFIENLKREIRVCGIK